MIVPVDILKEIAEIEFSDIVVDVFTDLNTMRIIFTDESYCDIWFSLKLVGRFSFHWERTFLDGTIYRHDNAPHLRWKEIKTFPQHFHNSSENCVEESCLPVDPATAIRFFLTFVSDKMQR
jgi:hypothetical protein